MTVHIIGNGLFGRIASDMLTKEGIDNIVYDSGEKHSGSAASGNITKPSWVTGLGDAARQAYRDLDGMYGLHKFTPDVGLGRSIELFYVKRDQVLGLPAYQAKVTKVGDGNVTLDNGYYFSGPVLVAAGVWSNELLPEVPKIEPVTGVSFVFRKPEGYTSKFNVWAPYKQAISYPYERYVWFGDGQAIKAKNWQDERIKKALERAKEHGLGLDERPLHTNVGYRPFVKGHKNGYFARVRDKVWVSTGGGKNGIVLAAAQARRFMEELQDSGYR